MQSQNDVVNLPEKTDDPGVFTVAEDAVCETGLTFRGYKILLGARPGPNDECQTPTWRGLRAFIKLFRDHAPEDSPQREHLTNLMEQITGPWAGEREYRLKPRNG